MSRPFTLNMPDEVTTGVVFASPHSGRDYAGTIGSGSVLDGLSIRSSEDGWVDDLFSAAPAHGAPLLAAEAPRAFVDLNRSADELDPALIAGIRRTAHNPRVSSGLGVIPRVVSNGRAIYRGKISLAEAQDRIDRFWQPYHATLAALLDDAHRQFGQSLLVDCHSMPREALENVIHPDGLRPEIVLGDRFGAACAPGLIDAVEAAFQSHGLMVIRNAPFAGAFTAQRYGRPSRQQNVIQVEIDRALYMDEATLEPNAHYPAFRAVLSEIVGLIAEIARPSVPLAAE